MSAFVLAMQFGQELEHGTGTWRRVLPPDLLLTFCVTIDHSCTFFHNQLMLLKCWKWKSSEHGICKSSIIEKWKRPMQLSAFHVRKKKKTNYNPLHKHFWIGLLVLKLFLVFCFFKASSFPNFGHSLCPPKC